MKLLLLYFLYKTLIFTEIFAKMKIIEENSQNVFMNLPYCFRKKHYVSLR